MFFLSVLCMILEFFTNGRTETYRHYDIRSTIEFIGLVILTYLEKPK